MRGNNDSRRVGRSPTRNEAVFASEGVVIYALHDLSRLDIEPSEAGVDVVVSGHSHRPRIEQREGVLYVNPGSAGPRRFKLPIALAELLIVGKSITPHIVELIAENPAKPRIRPSAPDEQSP